VGSNATQGLAANRLFVLPLRFFLDLGDEVSGVFTDTSGVEVSPAGQGLEGEGLFRGKVLWLVGFATLSGHILTGAIEPEAAEYGTIDKGLSAVGSWPLERRGDETLLAGLGENVAEPVYLGSRFITDENSLVAAAPELRWPIDQASDLAGEVGVEVLHEASESLGIGDGKQDVVVVGEEGEGVDPDRVEAFGSGQDPEDYVAGLLVRPQEVATLDGSAGDLDEAASLGDEA